MPETSSGKTWRDEGSDPGLRPEDLLSSHCSAYGTPTPTPNDLSDILDPLFRLMSQCELQTAMIIPVLSENQKKKKIKFMD